MTAPLPQALKIPSIQPFATRAAQLEKIRPIISYWCYYHVVNQILGKQLHSADEESRDYTLALMDKLEAAKNQTPPEDAIVDDVAAKAYVEQFALETFQRADTAIHSDRASRQTIETFQAASTFLELLATWSPLDAETTAKIKYAKYHALRIAKAIKAGEDPNASNPKDDVPADDVLIEPAAVVPSPAGYQPPSVEAAPDSFTPAISDNAATVKSEPDVSPLEPTDASLPTAGQSQNATPGEYFPPVPTSTSESPASLMPTADANAGSTIHIPVTEPSAIPPQDFYTHGLSQSADTTVGPPAEYPPASAAPIPPPVVAAQPIQPVPAPPPQLHPASSTGTAITQVPPAAALATPAYRTDDEAVAQAQKHAKWAISALNFEDVPTAIKELRLGLQALGAS